MGQIPDPEYPSRRDPGEMPMSTHWSFIFSPANRLIVHQMQAFNFKNRKETT